ncbi:MAG TPA: hypothetical protein VI685_17705 [Candidatus Angelobacter sp.]
MTNQNDNRVLNRRGARLLSIAEARNVTGNGHVPTITVCTFDFRARAADSDIETC